MEKRSAKEDYLRVIYELHEERGIKSVEIAEKLKVSKASVSEMLRKLADDKLVKMNKYSRVKLTKKGVEIAEKLYKKYDFIKEFMKMIGHEEDEANQHSHILEHALHDDSVNKIKNYFKVPEKKEMPSYVG